MASASAVEGHSRNSEQRLLIIHCDDLGLGHCVNEAAFHAFENGCITSGSVMAACPSFSEVVRYAREHPSLDLGVHLTLTSEWSRYRWKPVAAPDKIPTLVDAEGYMWPDADSVMQHADRDEVALELRSQIEAVIAAGLTPTHLDSHMIVLLRNRSLFSIYVELGRKYSLPILVPLRPGMNLRGMRWSRREFPLDCYFAATPEWAAAKWLEHYVECVDRLIPGVNQITVHLARHDREMKAIQCGHEGAGWSGEWRQRDFDVVCSESFRTAIRAGKVQLTTWGALPNR